MSCFQQAIQATKDSLPSNLPLCGFEKVINGFDNLNTAAGFSFPGQKKYEVLKPTYLMSRNMLHRLKNGYKIYQPPMKIAFRGHLSSLDDQKVRPVWVQPFETLILEALFAHNVYEALKQNGKPFHFGENSMPRLWDLMSRDIESYNQCTVTLDWSKFDANCPRWLIHEAFDILESMIDFSVKIDDHGYEYHYTEKE